MSFDGWVILVIIIGVIGAGVSLVIAEDAARTRREFITGSISLWLIGYTVIAGLTCFGTSNARPSPPWKEAAPNAKIAEQLGLVSGTQYDLVLGGRTGGSSGSTSTTAISGLFSARATASSSSSPASAISLPENRQSPNGQAASHPCQLFSRCGRSPEAGVTADKGEQRLALSGG